MFIGLKSAIALLDSLDLSASIEWTDLSFPADNSVRLNDGKADDLGRLWYGTVSAVDESQAVGCLSMWAPWAQSTVFNLDYRVPNGPAISKDSTYLLHNDSARRITYRFDIDSESNRGINRTVWRRFEANEGAPDGMDFDGDGCFWIAQWGAGRVCRYDRYGTLLLNIPMPVTNVTNVCFGGRNFDRIFVTSTTHGLSPERLSSETADGALFEITGTNVRGLPPRSIRL